MKYKRLLIPLFIVVFLVSFLFPASAAVNYISLKNLIDPMNSSDFFNVYVTTTSGTDVFLSYSWWTDNILRFDQPAQSGTYNKLRLVSIQPNSDPYMISDGDVLYMNCGYWILTDIDEIKNSFDLIYDINVGFVDKSGNPYSVTVLADKKGDYVFNDGRIGIFFEFQYTFPSYAYRLTHLTYEFEFTSTDTTFLQLSSDGKTQFYLGNSQNAPVFSGPDTSAADEEGLLMGAIRDQIGDGKEDSELIFGDFSDSFVTGSPLSYGLLAVGSMFNDLMFGIPFADVLIKFGLGIGIFAFILGMSSLVVGRFRSSSERGSSVADTKSIVKKR